MKSLLLAITMMFVGSSALAVVYVPYNRWTYLPHCGGQTRLVCDDQRYARQNDNCRIEFRNSYGCSQIKMYVGTDFHPTYKTYYSSMQGEFYVDNDKVNWATDAFRVFMNSGEGSAFEKVIYQFNY